MNWYLISMGCGVAIGFGAGYMCFQAQLEVQQANGRQAVRAAQAEIARLRAQVARIIGREGNDNIRLLTTDGARLVLPRAA